MLLLQGDPCLKQMTTTDGLVLLPLLEFSVTKVCTTLEVEMNFWNTCLSSNFKNLVSIDVELINCRNFLDARKWQIEKISKFVGCPTH